MAANNAKKKVRTRRKDCRYSNKGREEVKEGICSSRKSSGEAREGS